MKISVIGLGYVGLPTAAIIASRGIEVIGVDINQHLVDKINQKQVHIVESELDILVKASVITGLLRATTRAQSADAFIIAVPTPLTTDCQPDLSYIRAAVMEITPLLEKGNLVVLESTSPVGTTEKMIDEMRKSRRDLTFPSVGTLDDNVDIAVAHCPERVLPGRVTRELVENDRIIGGVTKPCADKAKALYKLFVQGECVVTDARTAELSKLVENAFRDVNIAFANELSLICDKLGIDVWQMIQLANRHPRVNVLRPGPGVGGHCIAVDPWFIVHSAPEQSKLIQTARDVNNYKPNFVLKKIEQAIARTGKERGTITIATLGLAYKANIDDLRESPALKIAQRIEDMSAFYWRCRQINFDTPKAMLDTSNNLYWLKITKCIPVPDSLIKNGIHYENKP